MKHLIEITDRFKSMADAYETRKKDAAERIVSLSNDLQQAKDAMNAAAANDDMVTFQEAEARVRYLTARIEAAKREQVEPIFHDATEAEALHCEYLAAVKDAVKPLYTRLMDTFNEQRAILKELRNIEKENSAAVFRISSHTAKARHMLYPWRVDPSIKKYLTENNYAAAAIKRMLEE